MDNEKVQKGGDTINKEKGMAVMAITLCRILQEKTFTNNQSVSCEIKFAHAHVRARLHVCDVRAKRLLKCVRDVRAFSSFFGVRRAIAILHVLG